MNHTQEITNLIIFLRRGLTMRILTVCISKQLAFLSEPCTINSPCIIFIVNFLRVISKSISCYGISVEHKASKRRLYWHYKDTERKCPCQQFSHGTHSHIQRILEGFYRGKTAGG